MLESKKKRLTKREKVIAAIVTVTIAAVPFFGMPAYEGYAIATVAYSPCSSPSPSASPSPSPTTIDLICDMTLPVNVSKVIDLNVLYGISTSFSVEVTGTPFANYNQALLQSGLLQIETSGATGQATFTVYCYDSMSTKKETFHVNTVAVGSDGRVDIGDVVAYLNSSNVSSPSTDDIQGILHAIGPKSVTPVYTGGNRDPYFKNVGFNPPVSLTIGQTLILGNLDPYFKDDDVGDILQISVVSSNESIVHLFNDGGWRMNAAGAGDADITIAARDGKGGVGLHKFTVHVPNTPPTIVKNFYHNYHISPGSSYNLDLSTYFSDPDPGDSVTHYTYSVPNSIIEHPISDSTLTLDPNMNTIYTISAYDNYGGKTSQSLTVTSSTYDPFKSQNLYKNSNYDIDLTNIFGTSAPLEYTFSSSVTASVYSNSDNHHKYLRINGFSGGTQEIIINAVDPAANEIYVDTLTIKEIFATTQFFIVDLFPGVTSATPVFATIDNPSITVGNTGFEVSVSGSSGQSGILTIIIDGGKKRLTIPVTINNV
jgi:hypothetical protein